MTMDQGSVEDVGRAAEALGRVLWAIENYKETSSGLDKELDAAWRFKHGERFHRSMWILPLIALAAGAEPADPTREVCCGPIDDLVHWTVQDVDMDVSRWLEETSGEAPDA